MVFSNGSYVIRCLLCLLCYDVNFFFTTFWLQETSNKTRNCLLLFFNFYIKPYTTTSIDKLVWIFWGVRNISKLRRMVCVIEIGFIIIIIWKINLSDEGGSSSSWRCNLNKKGLMEKIFYVSFHCIYWN